MCEESEKEGEGAEVTREVLLFDELNKKERKEKSVVCVVTTVLFICRTHFFGVCLSLE